MSTTVTDSDFDGELSHFNMVLGEYGKAVLDQKDVYNKSDAVTELFKKCKSSITAQKIGMLRQWLNEDRITDYTKMVTNEEIMAWLK
jgi:hypothetical protein